ncbi:hypothetical protein PNEG_01679 [Pneumocystis murina B123]|uniref:Uncharacterized protein n=1 Tax=Pneumocystis murina (strain B123) TaxID=1069680 RepID=M7P7T0_PNEMU|nr:hypothetical protein PNEG_01679 [Pneumocystis murina B123]EMR09920.1 hypothetical protein PNEG_01679 [Pneumocystis murina B123]
MSKAAKITFFTTATLALGTVGGVHYIQNQEKEKLYAGVLRDEAREAIRKEHQEKQINKEKPETSYKKIELSTAS